jgi:Protein of unknown function (DUF3830)
VKLNVELPAKGIAVEANLYEHAAPRVTRLIYEALAEPLETHTSHACFDGHEIYCFLPPFAQAPPLENRTMRPRPGEIMFFHAAPNEFLCTRDERLSGGSQAVFELAFIYGEVDLRHYWEEGFHGSLVGQIEGGLAEFAEACGETLRHGQTPMRLSRGVEG